MRQKIRIDNISPLESSESPTLMAGAASVDITPPPGMPMAGFAMYSCSAVGVRTRLKARIFYIKPKTGGPVALVQCDLLSGSLLLHHRIAELVAQETDIEAGAIAIMGTHTHSGPGNFFENKMYNDNASNKPGLDDQYVAFCSKQIAGGIIKACRERKPARIATGITEVYGTTINRALPPYLSNENIKNRLDPPDALRAINPNLILIRVDVLDQEENYKPLGAFTSFSMHPNTNPAELGCLYSGDITGFVARLVEAGVKNHYGTPWNPVLATANGTHGDCNPNHAQDRVENYQDHKKLAQLIAEKTLALFYTLDQQMQVDVDVRFRTREINLLETPSIDGIRISSRGYAGMSVLAGALGRGRITPFYRFRWFRPGRPRNHFTRGSQGHKRILGGPLQRLLMPKRDIGHRFLAQIIQLADVLLIPLPWEVTQEMGRRIADTVKTTAEDAGLHGITRAVVVDTANGYIGYLTTPEEYALQYYEGGSNLYGPHSGPYVAAQVGRVAGDLAEKGSGSELPLQWEFSLPVRSYYPRDCTPSGTRKAESKPEFHARGELEESFWRFTWIDVPPSRIEFHKPLVRLEFSRDAGNWVPLEHESVPVDDEGPDLAVIYRQASSDGKMGHYEVRWHNPVPGNDDYRFSILPRAGQEILYSEPFRYTA
ncbi:neutral/alkaline non-lysosomal ceramidase N-terminal domain-containing protein [bacterium]|nr:neutral/alkaline non-lysosomal ceramidase N-terminal domain-containing protein [bacterium]